MQLALGYWRSQVLFTALELGVFERLRDRPLDAAAVAKRCGSEPRRTESLLEACVALGLLKQADRRYSNGEMVETFLLEGAPQYMGNWIRFMGQCYGPWGSLAANVRTGRPVEAMRPGDPAAGAYTRSLILGMHDYANGPGREMVRHLDLTGRRRLLDVGGGPGTYSLLLARQYPDLEAVVLDLPPVVEIARELIQEWGLADRVCARAASYLTDDLGSGFDVVLLSNMLHQEDPDTCREILRKARAALVDGGLLVIQATFLDAEKAAQTWAILQTIQLQLFYGGGRNYSVGEMAEMVRHAGFRGVHVKRMSLINSTSLILAVKAARNSDPEQARTT